MAKEDFETVVSQVRLDRKQRALQQAMLVPWQRLEETAAAYVEWHRFVLWVRAIAERESELPEILREALAARCPVFMEDEIGRRQSPFNDQSFLWHSLEEWIAAHHFAEAKGQGWFDAVMFYAYKDLRTEQVWSLWQRTKEAWNAARPSRWPNFQEWTVKVIGTHTEADVLPDEGELLCNVLQRRPGCRASATALRHPGTAPDTLLGMHRSNPFGVPRILVAYPPFAPVEPEGKGGCRPQTAGTYRRGSAGSLHRSWRSCAALLNRADAWRPV